MSQTLETYHVKVFGLVQGVGFRLAAARQAHALKVTGWVCNLEDGSIEAKVQGTSQPIDEMLQWFNFGSRHAKVSRLEIEKIDTDQRFEGFQQR